MLDMPHPRTPNAMDAHIARRLRILRQRKKMSLVDVAEALGITHQQCQKYETGQNRISASRLREIASVLGVPMAFFFEDGPDLQSSLPQADLTDIREMAMFLNSAEGRALSSAFARIGDVKLRKTIVQLVDELAKAPEGTSSALTQLIGAAGSSLQAIAAIASLRDQNEGNDPTRA